jgi:ferredoxin-NADP reductase
MMKFVDSLLNRITMYRLVLYHLLVLLLAAAILSWFGLLPFTPWDLAASSAYLVAVCWIANFIFSRTFGAPTNVESAYITALILALIITPATNILGWMFLSWAGLWAMAVKYMIAIRKKHLFNPAAFAVALTALTINQSASWWVGTLAMLPFVIAGGLLIIRKQRQFAVVAIMLAAALALSLAFSVSAGFNPLATLQKITLYSPLFFFASVMFTEPLTMPPSRRLQAIYALLVGLLFAPQIHIGTWYSTPELALLAGNMFSYAVSPKIRRLLRLVEKVKVTPDTYDFVFAADTPFTFKPGQYMEWTLPHGGADSRGNRRYFTLASSPQEPNIRLGVKFYPQPSSFKKALAALQPGDTIVAAQLAGDFVLPRKPTRPCVFIAGGIGITPFRSIIQSLLDTNTKRPITVFYAARTVNDFAYWDILERARKQLGVTVVYIPSDTAAVPKDWQGESGQITPEMIGRYVPDYSAAQYYISGPHAMVVAFRTNLKSMGIARRRIKTDFFPGFA